MSRMKKLANAAITAGAALALGAAQTLGRIIAGGPDTPTDRNGRAWTPSTFRRAMRYRGYGRSRYMPHQGIQEQYRRRGQIMRGKLAFYSSSAEPTPAEPTPVKASTLIENGREAERRAKRSEAARKAAATRAARRLEAANG